MADDELRLDEDYELADGYPGLDGVEYAGFWRRVLAQILDAVIISIASAVLLLVLVGPEAFAPQAPLDPDELSWSSMLSRLSYGFGPEFYINYGFPLFFTLLFWELRSATPGKLMMGVMIIDADSGGKPVFGRLVLRYFAYLVSALPLMLGFLWVAFDKRKQGFHDKIAHTLVVRRPDQEELD